MTLSNKENAILSKNQNLESQEMRALCFSQSTETGEDIRLKMIFSGEKGESVEGFLNWKKNSQQESKGSFFGIAGTLNQQKMARTANLWWYIKNDKEMLIQELEIVFGDGSAQIATGPYYDRGDNVFLYKNRGSLLYEINLQQVNCDTEAMKIFNET